MFERARIYDPFVDGIGGGGLDVDAGVAELDRPGGLCTFSSLGPDARRTGTMTIARGGATPRIRRTTPTPSVKMIETAPTRITGDRRITHLAMETYSSRVSRKLILTVMPTPSSEPPALALDTNRSVDDQ